MADCGCGKKVTYSVTTADGTKTTNDKAEAYALASRFGATVTKIAR